MSKNQFTLVLAVLIVVLVTLAVLAPLMDALASNSESEPKRGAVPGANEAGMKIYKESEWANYSDFISRWNEEGLRIYHESERSGYLVAPAVSNEEGLAIYHASERNRTPAPPQRLFNGQPFNAYQRSEWLGEDR